MKKKNTILMGFFWRIQFLNIIVNDDNIYRNVTYDKGVLEGRGDRGF